MLSDLRGNCVGGAARGGVLARRGNAVRYEANGMTARHMLISRERRRYKSIDGAKTAAGAFFTRGTSWLTAPVRAFLEEHTAANRHVLDPFAGDGDILGCLHSRYDIESHGYDLNGSVWTVNDSLRQVPNPYCSVICTNPPYLAKHSAKRKGLWGDVRQYYERHYDLYELAIEKCMENAPAGVFIVPETFLHSSFPKHKLRLASVILDNPFTDTENPVCVACFDGRNAPLVSKGSIYVGDNYSCHISKIDRASYKTHKDKGVSFNDADGNIALKAIDGTNPEDRIRFEQRDEFYYNPSKVKVSSRLLTYIKVAGLDKDRSGEFLSLANGILDDLRCNTDDLILSPFKGNNKLGIRRRRLDYALARYIVNESLEKMAYGPRQQGRLL